MIFYLVFIILILIGKHIYEIHNFNHEGIIEQLQNNWMQAQDASSCSILVIFNFKLLKLISGYFKFCHLGLSILRKKSFINS